MSLCVHCGIRAVVRLGLWLAAAGTRPPGSTDASQSTGTSALMTASVRQRMSLCVHCRARAAQVRQRMSLYVHGGIRAVVRLELWSAAGGASPPGPTDASRKLAIWRVKFWPALAPAPAPSRKMALALAPTQQGHLALALAPAPLRETALAPAPAP